MKKKQCMCCILMLTVYITNLSELILLIESFKHKPNIIAITEYKDKCSKEVYIQEFSITGYVLYCNDTSNLSRGVLLYDDSNLESSEVFFDSLFKEFVIVKIKGANGVHLTICNV